MKLSWVYKVTSIYKMSTSEFSFRWLDVMPALWPDHYEAKRKCSNALHSESTSESMLIISRFSYIRPLSMTHMEFWPNDLFFGSFVRGHIRSNSFYAFIVKSYGDRGLGMGPMCFTRTDASTDMHLQHDLLGSPRELTWSWPEVKFDLNL